MYCTVTTTMKKEKTINEKIISFLEIYFQKRNSIFLKNEIPQHKELIEIGVLYEIDNDTLSINNSSIELQKNILKIAESKLNKKLPSEIPDAFNFIEQFVAFLKKEFNCEGVLNSFDKIRKGLKLHILLVLYKAGVNINDFLLLLNENDFNNKQLRSFIKFYFSFLPHSNYSEEEIFHTINIVWANGNKRHDIIVGLRNYSKINFIKSNNLLEYALKENVNPAFVTHLLIGLYNSHNSYSLIKIIELRELPSKNLIYVLGRLEYKNAKDVEKAFKYIGDLDFKNKDIANNQSYLLTNLIDNKYSTTILCNKVFKLYSDFLNNSTEEISHNIIRDIMNLKTDNYDNIKYKLLHIYLTKTKNFTIFKVFFTELKDPKYIFDLMIKLFQKKPDYRFSLKFFQNGIRHSWNTNYEETEKNVLNLFTGNPLFGILALKIILSKHYGIFNINLLKLDKSEYQINAINIICNHPHSFDTLLLLILPLRNSNHKEVREELQKSLAKKVFASYHEFIFNQIKENIGNTKKDKEFLKPIKKALDNYNKLKGLKASIDDLNPNENEKDLIDLYKRVEHEQNAKMMKKIHQGEGTFMEHMKSSIIVRGNSFKFNDDPPTILTKHESNLLIDRNSYLNPDLYEYNLNSLE